MSITATLVEIPAGTWKADELHSNAGFEVEHAGVSIFRGSLGPVQATLTTTDGQTVLEGEVDVETISIDDENIRPHLLSPEFFDVERNPKVTYRSTEVTGAADDLVVRGELSMAGTTVPVAARGRLRGPVEAGGGGQKLSIALETVVDRTDFGMNWQMELPSGGAALANEVKLIVELEFNQA